jgi:protocatechuate 3,4-dioxygenase beta subunit
MVGRGVELMTDTPTRRALLRAGGLGAGVFAAGSVFAIDGSVAQAPLAATPACHDGDEATLAQTEGPFFKPSSPERIELLEEGMAGQPIELVGLVLTRACKPVPGALLEFWQADDKGRYDNSGFRLRGHQFCDAEGRYRLRTVVPGLYPGRTRHIHVKVQPRGGRMLTTQLYFPGEAQNRSDGLFRKELLVRTAKNAGSLAGRFDFVLG